MLHYAVDSALRLVCGLIIGNSTSARRDYRPIQGVVCLWSRARLAWVLESSRFWHGWSMGYTIMNTVFGIPSSSMVIVCNWTLLTRKGPSVQPNNLLYVPFAKDDATRFLAFACGGLATKTKLCDLNASVSRTQQ